MSGATSRRRRAETLIVFAAIALGVPVALSGLGSTSDARFGANETLGPNALAAATLSIGSGSGTVDLVVESMAPGDRARGRLDVVNDGSLPLVYALDLDYDVAPGASAAIAEALSIEMWVATSCGDTPPSQGAVVAPRRPIAVVGRLFGNPTAGVQPGDRRLGVGERDTLCYSVTMALDATNALQGQTLTQSFRARAEHDLETEEGGAGG